MRKAVRVTMKTCTAPMHIHTEQNKIGAGRAAFTITELIVVVLIVALFVFMPQINLLGLLRKSTFRAQAQKLASTMQMAASAAAESDRRYEIIIDITQQSYILRQITNPDLAIVLDEEIIYESDLAENCRVLYVFFDDGDFTNEGPAKFRAGRNGWQYGGRIALVDEDGRVCSLMVTRLNREVQIQTGEPDILAPRLKNEMLF